MSALEWLDAVRARLDAATPGPWDAARPDFRFPAHVITGGPSNTDLVATNVPERDAALVAHAQTDLDRMERALRGVTLMHTPEPQELKTIDGFDRIVFCRECGLEWGDSGCPTVAAIEEALGNE